MFHLFSIIDHEHEYGNKPKRKVDLCPAILVTSHWPYDSTETVSNSIQLTRFGW